MPIFSHLTMAWMCIEFVTTTITNCLQSDRSEMTVLRSLAPPHLASHCRKYMGLAFSHSTANQKRAPLTLTNQKSHQFTSTNQNCQCFILPNQTLPCRTLSDAPKKIERPESINLKRKIPNLQV